MVMEYQWSCVQKGCKAHVHIRVYCHDDDQYDPDQLANVLGFYLQSVKDGFLMLQPQWYCKEHS